MPLVVNPSPAAVRLDRHHFSTLSHALPLHPRHRDMEGLPLLQYCGAPPTVLISAGPMSQSAISAATAAAVAADNKNDGVGYYQSAVSLGLMEVVFVNGLGVPSQVILRSVQLRTYRLCRLCCFVLLTTIIMVYTT